MVETKPEPNCDPKYILQNLEATKNKASKLDFITDTLERCAIATTPSTKKKRGMTGYNCYIRVSVKKGQKFKEVVKSKSWSQLPEKSKETWKSLAKEGCPPRLWE